MPCPPGEPRTGGKGRAGASGPAVPGLHRRCMEGGPLRRLQAFDEEEHPVSTGSTASPGFRSEAAGSHRGGRDQAVVRPVQPDRARQRQSRPRPASADPELRHRLRPHRKQSRRGHRVQPAAEAHAVPVPGRTRPPAQRPGRACPEGRQAAGGHRPPSAADRMPQGRDRHPAPVRGSRRHAGPWRQQDGAEESPPQQPGPGHSRPAAAHRQPVRLPLAPGRIPPALSGPHVLVSCQGAKPASRTCAFTTSGIPMRATR